MSLYRANSSPCLEAKGLLATFVERTFAMLKDPLRDTPAYQRFLKEGRELERQQNLERQRQMLVEIVQGRFPTLLHLTKGLAAMAAKFQHPSILPAIRTASPGVELAKREPVSLQFGKRDAREAVEKSVTLLQKATVTFLREGGCVGCHAQNITSIAVAAARAKGVPVDEEAAKEVARGTRLQFAAFADFLLERMDPPATIITIYSLVGLSAEHAEPDRITDALVHNIAAQQSTDGSWGAFGILRPPTADSKISTTAFAVRALRHFAPPARKAEFDERIARATAWLTRFEPTTTEDVVSQLLGFQWGGADAALIDRTAKRLLALERADGGWAQTPHLQSDAFATGTALYALNEAGMAGAGERI